MKKEDFNKLSASYSSLLTRLNELNTAQEDLESTAIYVFIFLLTFTLTCYIKLNIILLNYVDFFELLNKILIC